MAVEKKLKQEFVQLAHVFDPNKHNVLGWYCSNKLDGQRCIWDGGISRGLLDTDVPFANTAKNKTPNICTGLWSRYGKVIFAPDYFLDSLPKNLLLDGELYLGLNSFQKLMSIVKEKTPGDGWKKVKYCVFDSPSPAQLFANRSISTTVFTKTFTQLDKWPYLKRLVQLKADSFQDVYAHLEDLLQSKKSFPYIRLHKQTKLKTYSALTKSLQHKLLNQSINGRLNIVTKAGGEGLILRNPNTLWIPQRTHNILKVKKRLDAEGTVVGYVWGNKTDKGSRYLGMMGGLLVKFNDKTFELSGFTNDERRLVYKHAASLSDEQHHKLVLDNGTTNQGKPVSELFHNPMFPIGTTITFTYRELTESGIPKEAQYYRIYESV